MKKRAEQRLRKRFDGYFVKKEKQKKKEKAEEIVDLIITVLEKEFEMEELNYSLTGFDLYENVHSTFSLVLWPCQDYPTIKEIEAINQIPFDQEVFESVKKFLASLRKLKKCSLKNKTCLEVLF